MKNYIQPSYLQKGDKAIIISPSGNIESYLVDEAKEILESWGLNVFISSYAKAQLGRFCGTIEERLFDLQTAMDDPDIKLIFCSRGGYGIVHLLDKLDFTEIRKYPKWIVGYSDITALHFAFMQHGIKSLHAPMARHLVEEGTDDIATNYLREILFSGFKEYTIPSNPLNRLGSVTGYLWGGNLAVLGGLIGTSYTDIPSNGILFIEDIGESPYKIDRMMWQLKLSGILESCSGLIVGQFTECDEDPLMYDSVYSLIKEIAKEYDYPIVFDFPVGHVKNNYPLICSQEVILDVQSDVVIMKISD